MISPLLFAVLVAWILFEVFVSGSIVWALIAAGFIVLFCGIFLLQRKKDTRS
jgi:hypothetical protein